MENNFRTRYNLNIYFLKFYDDQDLWTFISNGGIIRLLAKNNHSAIGAYIERPNKKSDYILSEYLISDLSEEEYNSLCSSI